jgi:hypothetical protein
MTKRIIFGLVWVLISSSFNFCMATSIDKIQGVYVVDKVSLMKSLLTESGVITESSMKSVQAQMKEEGASFELMANLLLANTIIEFNIKGDSINGIISVMGETSLIKSLIIERNDSLVVKRNQHDAYLIPIEKGLLFRISGSKLSFKLLKTDRKELSFIAKEAIQKEREKEKFEQNLGKWQKGNYIDEFGDEIKDGYAYVWIEGTKQSSTSTKEKVYIMAFVKNEKLNFQFYDRDMDSKESLPDDKFGIMKLKFSDGTIKSEKIYFTSDGVFESGEKAVLFKYISENSDLVKVLIDLNTAESYYSDKYIFSIEKNNLDTIRNEMNK